MPRTQSDSFGNQIQNWENLVRSYDEHADILAPALVHRDALAAIVEQARVLKSRQFQFIGMKQRATQDTNQVMSAGQEAARCLRRVVAATMGTDNELLAQFQIPPRRSRKRKTTGSETPSPDAPPEEPEEPEEPETPPVE